MYGREGCPGEQIMINIQCYRDQRYHVSCLVSPCLMKEACPSPPPPCVCVRLNVQREKGNSFFQPPNPSIPRHTWRQKGVQKSQNGEIMGRPDLVFCNVCTQFFGNEYQIFFGEINLSQPIVFLDLQISDEGKDGCSWILSNITIIPATKSVPVDITNLYLNSFQKIYFTSVGHIRDHTPEHTVSPTLRTPIMNGNIWGGF